jgi:aminocarboxymuconate-semialdehyde decarboxylase
MTDAGRSGVVDVHAHFIAPEVFAVTSSLTPTLALARDPSISEAERSDILRRADIVHARMSDVVERLAAMDRMGVERQVLSPSLVHQCTYQLPANESLQLERRSNDWIASKAATAPHRFIAFGSVPLQAPELAVSELRRCVGDLGLRGVAISTHAGGREIGDPALHPFWAEAQALGAPIYVHPAGNREARFAPYALWNSVGQCFEEAMAIASLMYEGVLERFPKLRICISHGGGYMPQNMGRVDRNWLEKPATRVNMTKPPVEYLKMLWYDSCLYDQDALKHLIARVGAGRVVLGSDYPVGETNPLGFIESCTATLQERDKIARSNVRGWLGE